MRDALGVELLEVRDATRAYLGRELSGQHVVELIAVKCWDQAHAGAGQHDSAALVEVEEAFLEEDVDEVNRDLARVPEPTELR